MTSATPSDGQVVLIWTSPDDGGSDITGYVIYRGTETGAETELTALGVVLTYTDDGLTNGQSYFYTVSAVNEVGREPVPTRSRPLPRANHPRQLNSLL